MNIECQKLYLTTLYPVGTEDQGFRPGEVVDVSMSAYFPRTRHLKKRLYCESEAVRGTVGANGKCIELHEPLRFKDPQAAKAERAEIYFQINEGPHVTIETTKLLAKALPELGIVWEPEHGFVAQRVLA